MTASEREPNPDTRALELTSHLPLPQTHETTGTFLATRAPSISTLIADLLNSPVTALTATFITDMANAPDAPHGYYLSPPKASATASTSLCVVLPLIP